MKLQLTTIATASLLFTSLVSFFPSNASASPVRASAIIVADNHCTSEEVDANGKCPGDEGYTPTSDDNSGGSDQ